MHTTVGILTELFPFIAATPKELSTIELTAALIGVEELELGNLVDRGASITRGGQSACTGGTENWFDVVAVDWC